MGLSAAQQRGQRAQMTNAQSRKNWTCPAQQTRWRTTCSPTTVVRCLQKGSVLPQRCDTKRSVAVQTADLVEHEDSLCDWLTTSATTTAATQTKRCSSGAPFNTNRDPCLQLPSRTPTADLEQQLDRIQAIALDMSALNHCCNVDSNSSRAPQEPLRSAASRRAKRSVPKPQRRKRRSIKWPCSSTIEESSSSANRVERGAARNPHHPPPSPTFRLPLPNTFRSHDSTSHRTVHHERVTLHCSVTRSFRLRVEIENGPC